MMICQTKIENMNLDYETNLKMNLLKCSIVVTAYGVHSSAVEIVVAKPDNFWYFGIKM